MTKKVLEAGFKLFQPWATDVVRGKLNFLVRSIPTKRRGRVAVIATRGIDDVWLENANEREIKEIENKIGAIGSVEIKDCIEVKPNKVKNKLIELAGEKYWNYYPKYLIPEKTRTGMVYIWILDKAKEWKKIKEVEGGGIVWAKIKLEDE
ncbi:MAG: hypothetical protein H5T44_03315 [Thermoplasmatales archaeon]|nr:hypothetical protein [Thermoplasmatales archaeon]